MPSEIHPALSAMPETRRQILTLLKKRGSARSEGIAEAIGVTLSGTRQQMTALERDGLIAHSDLRDGRGRPKFVYYLTPLADSLFPRNYADLTNELLEYVEEADPALLDQIFDKRGARRLERARQRMAGLTFPEQVRVLTDLLDEDGYLAAFEAQPDGSYRIVEHNCAVMDVARKYGQACRTEIAFLRAALPDADVTRIAHMIAGQHVCAYDVRPKTSAT
ncbi:MAG: winged helix-turn-helix transcriptional regulator [Thermomicrobia bacterium]|nr:winged helix-turn-helix transcriptional regulator [Thermomicrobia bacterium]